MSRSVPLSSVDVPQIDCFDADFRRDPAAAFASARESLWIAKTVRGYEVISYDICREMCIDPRLDSIGPDYYLNLGATEPIMWYATQASLPMIGGARHDRIRKVLQHGFTRRAIDALRPTMREVAARLIDRLAERDPFDLVADFMHIYPIEVLCALMGVPEQDIDRFGAWTVDLSLLANVPLEPHMDRIDAAIVGLREYFADLVALRRERPGDDFVSTVLASQVETSALTEEELYGALLNLLFAGHDTTRYQFGTVVQLLVRNGEWERLQQNRDLVAGAIEEAMRLEPSLHILLRKVVEDVEYLDISISAGTLLVINTYAANRDPAAFPTPDRFDVTRQNANRHLTFGRGGHLCLGHALARAEMAEALALFLDRFPELYFTAEPTYPVEFSAMSGAERIPMSGSLGVAAS